MDLPKLPPLRSDSSERIHPSMVLYTALYLTAHIFSRLSSPVKWATFGANPRLLAFWRLCQTALFTFGETKN